MSVPRSLIGVRAFQTVMAALFLVALLPGSARGEVTMALEYDFPLKGSPVTITLGGREPGVSYDVHVTYRPNSETSKEEMIGTIAADEEPGSIQWTPGDAGITAVRVMSGETELASKNVAVRFDKAPLSGILIFLGAGILLFGGAMTSMRRVLGG